MFNAHNFTKIQNKNKKRLCNKKYISQLNIVDYLVKI